MMRAVLRRVARFEDRVLLARGDDLVTSELTRRLVARRFEARGFRTLAGPEQASQQTASARRIVEALRAVGGSRYLEIGIQSGLTLESVRADVVVGVDPEHRVNLARLPSHVRIHTVGSDEFFARSMSTDGPTTDSFDVVFVDGLHTFEQSYRDVINAFSVLSGCGVVIVDDTVPTSRFAALPDRQTAKQLQRDQGFASLDWMGDVFRTVLAIRRFHPTIAVATVIDEHHRGQTFMWRDQSLGVAANRLEPAHESDLASLRESDYEAVFASGVPEEFNRSSLADAIDARLRALS